MSILIYTRNNCSSCTNVKNFLNDRGVEYEERNVQANVEDAMTLVNHNISSVPTAYFTEEAKFIVGAAHIEAAVA